SPTPPVRGAARRRLGRLLRHTAAADRRGWIVRPAFQDVGRRDVVAVGQEVEKLCRDGQVFLALETARSLAEEVTLGEVIAHRTEAAERLVPTVGTHRLGVARAGGRGRANQGVCRG